MTDAEVIINDPGRFSHEETIEVAAPPEVVYDTVSDITRTGEWSPICVACWWDDPREAGQVGARFTGRNELPERTWQTRSQVVAAERGREFAWIVGDGFVRWGFALAPAGGRTELTESWQFLPPGLQMFREKYAADAETQIRARIEQAHTGITQTLAAIKRVVEGQQGVAGPG
ncbi:SRPBCC family protein [Janibacter alittae]|uniref:SRPBCC family protein n=1 Tax=Janibacter alittae TaxID=3115209 RepID=A0ABZ2ME86_9MICO